jgi:hypothetical protein
MALKAAGAAGAMDLDGVWHGDGASLRDDARGMLESLDAYCLTGEYKSLNREWLNLEQVQSYQLANWIWI